MKILKHLAKNTYLLIIKLTLKWHQILTMMMMMFVCFFVVQLMKIEVANLRSGCNETRSRKIDKNRHTHTTHHTHTHVFISWWSFKCIKQCFELVMIVVYSTNQVQNESLVSIEMVATLVVLSMWTNGAHQHHQRRRITAEKKKVWIS